MITIDGLTKGQVKLLDTMWDIDGYQEYMEWKDKLSTSTRREVEVLEQMITLAEIDDVEDVELAKKVLAKF
jgi:hypothetical protein